MSIRVFVTGGTFDKKYNEIDGALAFGDTHVLELLKLGRCKVPIKIRTLMMIDSLDDRMTIFYVALFLARHHHEGVVVD